MMKMINKMMYRIYLRYDNSNEYKFYGMGPIKYIHELIRDSLLLNDECGRKIIEYKIERCDG